MFSPSLWLRSFLLKIHGIRYSSLHGGFGVYGQINWKRKEEKARQKGSKESKERKKGLNWKRNEVKKNEFLKRKRAITLASWRWQQCAVKSDSAGLSFQLEGMFPSRVGMKRLHLLPGLIVIFNITVYRCDGWKSASQHCFHLHFFDSQERNGFLCFEALLFLLWTIFISFILYLYQDLILWFLLFLVIKIICIHCWDSNKLRNFPCSHL